MTEDPCELNGIGSGPSPPTYPLANSLSEVDDFTELDGAKAVADPASAAMVNKNLVMVMIFLLFECVKKITILVVPKGLRHGYVKVYQKCIVTTARYVFNLCSSKS